MSTTTTHTTQDHTHGRRYFLRRAAAYSLGFAGLSTGLGRRAVAAAFESASDPMAAATRTGVGYGPLIPDPAGVLDLPEGFEYSIVMRQGRPMGDGHVSPGLPDGMAAFPSSRENVCLLIRNHEIDLGHRVTRAFDGVPEGLIKSSAERAFDPVDGTPAPGGTSTIVFNTETGEVEDSFLSLAGTERNCAGGPTPWNSWLTCEETVTRAGEGGRKRDHGWVFEVPATEEPTLADAKPIEAMGRFNHEAVALSPSGIVYQTEDRPDGLIYRYIPNVPGDLHQGGRLQALAIEGRGSVDLRNRSRREIKLNEVLRCAWIDIDDPRSMDDTLRYQYRDRGAAVFARGEGMWAGADGIYFCCTNGGPDEHGQIFRLAFPGTEAEGADEDVTLELFLEPNDSNVLRMPDNITVAPNGHLVVCEDGGGRADCLVGVSPQGEAYTIARNATGNSELAGGAFSPDNRVLFVNIQAPGLTLAIRGPWAG